MKKISIFLIMLILSTLITISSNSWLGAWMGLEINLLSFIPLMNDKKKNLMTSESSIKYFLTQAFASSILMFSIIMLMFILNNNFFMNKNMIDLLILSSLLLKVGASPFHFWFPGVMEGLNWINNFILMTWQKIAPLMLISYNFNYYYFMISLILSMTIGSLGGLNQTSLRKLMAFSSINHLGWMLMAMMSNELLWFMYFIMYMMISASIIIMFYNFKLYHFNQIFNLSSKSMLNFFLFLNLLSMGGLPPFLGFMPKWLVIQSLTQMNQIMILFIAMFLTLITLFFYLRLSYNIFTLNNSQSSWILNINKFNIFNNSFFMVILNFISIFGLIFISLIYMIM
nr:NADH dehydrogenase subunit 2 [Aedeomyia squamipennis]